jgi:hypothetical protein
MAEYSYIGKGNVWVEDTAGRLVKFGNCSRLDVAVTEDVKELKDYTQSGGGLANSLRRTDKVELQLAGHDFAGESIAMALLGDATAYTAATAVTENVIAKKGSLVLLDKIGASGVVVENAAETTTYVAGTDYIVSNAGIYIMPTSVIADDDVLHVTYDHAAQNALQAMVNSSREMRLVFDGLNEAQSNAPVVLEFHRVKFGPTKNLSMIGDEFGVIDLTGDVLSDSTQAAGMSRYFKLKYV